MLLFLLFINYWKRLLKRNKMSNHSSETVFANLKTVYISTYLLIYLSSLYLHTHRDIIRKKVSYNKILFVKKPSASTVRDLGSIPGSGRSPGERNGNPLQYSCLENRHGQRSPIGYSPGGCKSQT